MTKSSSKITTKPLAPPNPDLPFHGDPSSAPDPYAMRQTSRRPLSDRARQEIRESLSRVLDGVSRDAAEPLTSDERDFTGI